MGNQCCVTNRDKEQGPKSLIWNNTQGSTATNRPLHPAKVLGKKKKVAIAGSFKEDVLDDQMI